jgi:hypothetical protein
MLAAAFDPELVAQAHDIIDYVREKSSSARNTLAHAQPTTFASGAEKPYWAFVRYASRRSHQMVIYPTDVHYWSVMTAMVADTAHGWRDTLAEMHEALKKLTPEDFDRICVLYWREIEPKFQRHHNLHPQESFESVARKAKGE